MSASILIVEDDEGVAEALATTLADEGYDVVVASNGEEGLDRLDHHARFDLILVDVMMPVMNGYAFRAAQLKDARWADVPTVFLTATTDANPDSRAGTVCCVRKPISLAALIEVIEARLGHA